MSRCGERVSASDVLTLRNWQAAVFAAVSDRPAPTTFHWYEPNARIQSHPVPGMTGMTLIRGRLDQAGAVYLDSTDPHVTQASRRAAGRAKWFRQFLQADDVRVEPTIIYESSGTQEIRDCFAYASVAFGDREEFLAFRKGAGILSTVQDYPVITVISGHCLFSNLSLRWRTREGVIPGIDILQDEEIHGMIEDFAVDPRPSLYELEASTRLAALIATIADRISYPQIRINLAYPRTQYYFALFGRYQRGEIDAELLQRWIEAVDQRYLEASQRTLGQLWSRSRRFREGELTIKVSDGLGDLDPTIRESITLGRLSEPATVFARLSECDDTWSLLRGVTTPQSWAHLSHLSYAAAYLRAALWRRGQKPQLLLAVEDPAERLIFGTAEQLAKLIRRQGHNVHYDALGVYPLERALSCRMGRRGRTHRIDPGYAVIDPDGHAIPIERLLGLLFPKT